jgi:hypothetical protein
MGCAGPAKEVAHLCAVEIKEINEFFAYYLSLTAFNNTISLTLFPISAGRWPKYCPMLTGMHYHRT